MDLDRAAKARRRGRHPLKRRPGVARGHRENLLVEIMRHQILELAQVKASRQRLEELASVKN